MICLAESIKDWIGQSPRIFCKSEEPYLQFGYEVLTFPVAEFAQIFGPLIYAINQAWPVQVFGMGSQDELVELSFTKEGTAPTIQQKNVSGIPCAELRDLYFCVKFPDPLAADCMFRLLDAVEKKLGISPGGITKDGLFSLDACRCIGACGLAPVMMINNDVYGRLTPTRSARFWICISRSAEGRRIGELRGHGGEKTGWAKPSGIFRGMAA